MLWLLSIFCALTQSAGAPFALRVVDSETGRGVPLVELRTTNDIRFVTDSNGIVAFHEPGLMGRRVFFHVSSHGYEFPRDGFGYRGKALEIIEGGRAVLQIRRINVAERLYRVTGAGIYRDSLLVGETIPIRRPILNARVTGSDSVVNAVYRGRIYWFWGDTNRPRYPLGNFHVPGAISQLPGEGGLDPAVGIDLEYFVGDDGFAGSTAKLPGEGPTWISGLVVLDDSGQRERLFAHYVKVRKGMEVYERGLVEFDDEVKRFEKVVSFPENEPFPHGGHPFLRTVRGVKYVYYCDPYPLVRVRADPEHMKRQESYEVFTCLAPGSRAHDNRFDRHDDGRLRWGWKRGTGVLGASAQHELVRSGKIAPEDAVLALRDVDTDKAVIAHRGSVYWNAYRRRWVLIAGETFGSPSFLGEIWYAEADRPLGPWVYARKIITHDKYSLYNPKHHPMLDQDGGRIIYLEGTYSATFSGAKVKTPRYDYNQVMYRLDLDDARLNLPVPVYEVGEVPGRLRTGRGAGESGESASLPIAFWALERPGSNTIAVFETKTERGAPALGFATVSNDAEEEPTRPIFHVLPATLESAPASTVLLFEYRQADGVGRAYATGDDHPALEGFQRQPKPVARVWRHPLRRGILHRPE